MAEPGNRLVEIARIGKVHGLEGSVRLQLSEEAEQFIEEGNLLYLKNRRGDLVPARIIDVRVEMKRNMRSFFVKFDRIADRSQAALFQDTPVYTDYPPETESPSFDAGRMEGFEVRDRAGHVGTVTGLMQNPAHPILVVKDKDENSILVPWVDMYVLSVDTDNHIVTCRNIDQLKSL
ncbi:MAG: ribosome maturation factor RimM [Balneolaceae bacterium]